MKIKSISLKKTAFVPGDILTDTLPKIAFIGRSNVGKSSLINRIMNRKRMAKTSSRPGKTLSVNYYLINDSFYLVDLPGYGYATIGREEADRVQNLINIFFERSAGVSLVMHLIDSRRGFLQSDLAVLAKLIEFPVRILTVLTKSDKVKSNALNRILRDFSKNYGLKAIPFTTKSDKSQEKILTIIKSSLKEKA